MIKVLQHIKTRRLAAVAVAQSLLAAVVMWSCSDTTFVDEEQKAPGAMTIQLSSSALSVNSRTSHANDREYYMGTVDIYFYPGGTESEASSYTISYDVEDYGDSKFTQGLSMDDVDVLFPDGATSCTVYAVANVHDKVKDLSNPSIEELKAIELTTDFPTVVVSEFEFPMSATSTITLDRNTMTMSGKISLERALAKISLELNVADEVKVESGTDDEGNPTYETYVPVVETAGEGSHVIEATIYNSATNGLLDGIIKEASGRGFTGASNKYTQSYSATGETSSKKDDDGNVVTTYKGYSHDAFYSYPTQWVSNLEEHEMAIKLKIAWENTTTKAEGNGRNINNYYYQIPINFNGKEIIRNHYYKINLTVGMLGSTSEGEPIEITEDDKYHYEVMNWGEDDYEIEAELTKNHYLVVEDNTYTIWNESTQSFTYSTCQKLEKIYLTEVSFYSTEKEETVYLYNTTYDSSTHTYTPQTIDTSDFSASQLVAYKFVQDIAENSATTQTFDADAKKAVSTANKEYPVITDVLDVDEDGTSLGSGTIYFNSNVLKVAAEVYRPVTYTIVLVNEVENHGGVRQTVKITQYPSKYIEFGSAGNVFIDGYFARLSPDNGLTTAEYWPEGTTSDFSRVDNNVRYYRSYSFICTPYNSTDEYYYSNSSNYNAASSITYGSATNQVSAASSAYGINTPYEYVRGSLGSSETLSFDNTIEVNVSAFTTEDNYFTINGEKRYYVLGDPRQTGSFTADTHHNTSSYEYSDAHLYDYLVKMGTHTSSNTTYYDRYVKSWGEEAGKIRIGGHDTKYDNIIAPLYKTQSSLGACIGRMYFDVAQKRCATYQEAGYPAGRWRLPTLAEIAFIVKLQNEKVINKFFNDKGTYGYWTSSGGCVKPSETSMTYTANASEISWGVCVYDLWYWQDGDPVTHQTLPTHQYHIKPTAEKTGTISGIIKKKK